MSARILGSCPDVAGVARYPTGDATIDLVVEFIASRLPALHKPDMSRPPSLAEQWWIEDICERPCPLKQGWRFVYRFARDQAVMRYGQSNGAADLLAHQLTVLMPSMSARLRGMLDDPHLTTPANAQGDDRCN